jgi:zinc protease
MLTMPTFPQKELLVFKKQIAGTLEAEAENTREQASQALSSLLFEPAHPNYSHTTKEKEILLKKTTRAQILAYHAKIGGKESLVAACAGGVSEISPEMFAGYFAKLTVARAAERPVLPIPHPSLKKGRATIEVKGKASIDYMVGLRFGITRAHNDYPALLLAARILGNPGFTGRLMKTVREKEGLTYGAYAFMRGFDSQADGTLVIWSTFAPSLFAQGRAAVLRELSRLTEEGPTDQEFKEHRDLFLANWHVRLTRSGAFAQAIHDTIVENEPLDYLDSFPKRVESVTKEDVVRCLRDYWRLDLLSEAAAGAVEKDALQ